MEAISRTEPGTIVLQASMRVTDFEDKMDLTPPEPKPKEQGLWDRIRGRK